MNKNDANSLRVAINVARHSREHGNHPFGAILVDASGKPLLAAENSVITQKDATAHAEMNLMRGATWKYDTATLKGSTLYASGEPCPMCAGAIVWGNIRRVVYGMGMDAMYEMFGAPDDIPSLKMYSRTVFESAPYPIEVIGPALEEEARVVHEGFWQGD